MAAVFTICPVNGQMIATGIETDEASLKLAPAFVSKIFCPHCQRDHEWTKDTAWLADGHGQFVRLT